MRFRRAPTICYETLHFFGQEVNLYSPCLVICIGTQKVNEFIFLTNLERFYCISLLQSGAILNWIYFRFRWGTGKLKCHRQALILDPLFRLFVRQLCRTEASIGYRVPFLFCIKLFYLLTHSNEWGVTLKGINKTIA